MYLKGDMRLYVKRCNYVATERFSRRSKRESYHQKACVFPYLLSDRKVYPSDREEFFLSPRYSEGILFATLGAVLGAGTPGCFNLTFDKGAKINVKENTTKMVLGKLDIYI